MAKKSRKTHTQTQTIELTTPQTVKWWSENDDHDRHWRSWRETWVVRQFVWRHCRRLSHFLWRQISTEKNYFHSPKPSMNYDQHEWKSRSGFTSIRNENKTDSDENEKRLLPILLNEFSIADFFFARFVVIKSFSRSTANNWRKDQENEKKKNDDNKTTTEIEWQRMSEYWSSENVKR